jgi:hypothetical protein
MANSYQKRSPPNIAIVVINEELIMVSQTRMNISEQFKQLFDGQMPQEQQGSDPAQRRRLAALKTRGEAALIAFQRPLPEQQNNGEEMDYRGTDGQPNFIANFTKGLPRKHYRDPDPKKNLGEVDPDAYKALLEALKTAQPKDLEAIPLGAGRKFVNPQAGLAFTLESADAQAVTVPPAPRIDGAENSAEMGELYWMALSRDVHFMQYDRDPIIAKAAKSLSEEFTRFRGPKQGNQVTPATLFRGVYPGELTGPYVSQFLLRGNRDPGSPAGSGRDAKDGFISYGALKISHRQRTVLGTQQAGQNADYLFDYNAWLDAQQGVDTSGQDKFDLTERRFIRNLRDLGNFVHFDSVYDAFLNACLFLLAETREGQIRLTSEVSELAVRAFPFDAGNPYRNSRTQLGFSTFGDVHILSLLPEVTIRALRTVWFQKWFVHRRLRPEAFGGLIHNHRTGQANYPIDQEILKSSVLEEIHSQYGTFLLPQAFPEGSPTHPAYGAGHATGAGACATILKAFFDESAALPDPLVANEDGTALMPYTGADAHSLTVGGELNKLAGNIAIARNGAGVHWRSDYTESLLLGEAIAIDLLQEQSLTYNEDLNGKASFTLTKFDNTKVKITDGKVTSIS